MIFGKELKKDIIEVTTQVQLARKRTKKQIENLEIKIDNLNARLDAFTLEFKRIENIATSKTLEAAVMKSNAENDAKKMVDAMQIALRDIPMDTWNVPVPEAQGQ